MLSVRSLLGCCLGALLFVGGCATPGTSTINPQKVTIPEFRAYLADLREGINEGSPREFNDKEMRQFEQINLRIMSLIDGRNSVQDLSEEERLALYNAQLELQAVLIGDRDNQVICRRQHTVGTNFKSTTCFTRKEWRDIQYHSREFVRQRHISPVVDPGEG